jgi:hypothetical protein
MPFKAKEALVGCRAKFLRSTSKATPTLMLSRTNGAAKPPKNSNAA